eukprot:jgi/Mesvir1/227/Mv13571-RA.2
MGARASASCGRARPHPWLVIRPCHHRKRRFQMCLSVQCKGLCFMLTRKTGLGLVSVSSGTGFVIAKLDDPAWPSDKPCPTTRWSGPVAVRVAVLGLGLEVGESETFHILVLNSQRALETFSSGKLDLGTNISNAGGPTATEVSAKFHLGKGGVAATFEYCYAEGNLLGATLTGGFVTPVRSRNRKFYGEDYAVKDILAGHVGADQWMRFPPLKELYETINTAEQGAGIDTDGNESRPSE